VHEDDPVRFTGVLQAASQEGEGVVVRSVHAVGSLYLDLTDSARSSVENDEAGVAVGELEVPQAMDLRPRLGSAGIVEVVVADGADIRQLQVVDQSEVVLVALARARPGEVAQVGEEHRRGGQPRGLPSSWR
jgi:hypothetical protein